jgi:hypothetical protein
MKAIITAVLLILVISVVALQASASGVISIGQGSFTGMGMNNMETKMTEALKSLGAKSQAGAAVETGSKQETIAPINNSLSFSARSINSITNSPKHDLRTDNDLSSLESSANSIASELESIQNETSSLVSSADLIRSSPEPYLADNNLSAFNTSALTTNLTGLNLSANNPFGSEKVDSGQSGKNMATQQIGNSISGAVNGFWGLQSSQHQTGRNDINSKTFLSGGFEVDKSVKFSDRGV